MKTRFGKITAAALVVLLVCVSIWIAAVMVSPVRAADSMISAHTILVAGSWTNPYAVFIDAEPGSATLGMVYDTTTGTAATGNTWAGNVNTVTKDDQSECHVVAVPLLPDNKQILMVIADNASPAKTDLMASSSYRLYYSPYTKRSYGADLPSGRGRIYTGQP